jgi:hypothetical protein
MKFLIKSGLSLTVVGLVSVYGALEAHTQSAFAQKVNKVDIASSTVGQEVKQEVKSFADTEGMLKPQQVLAQTEPPSLAEANRLRQELKIPPIDGDLLGSPASVYNPSPSPGGVPSAFGANLGEAYIGGYGATAGKTRDTVDGGIAVGVGLGDSRRAVGLEATYNLTSIRNFGSNGTFDLKLHRMIYESNKLQVAAAIGWTNFANYGTNAGGTPSSVYGVITSAFLLRPEDPRYNLPVTVSVGVGGGVYRPESLQKTTGGIGVFGSLGVQVHPQVALSTGWTGQGLNFGLSFLPVPSIPLNINAIYSDVGNTSTLGSQFIFGLTYGFNFAPRF